MPRTMLILSAVALLASGAPVGAGGNDEYPPFSREAEVESRSWSVGGYTKHEYKGRDSQGNRISGTIEELPSGTVKFKSKTQHNPVPGRVQRFLEQRQQR